MKLCITGLVVNLAFFALHVPSAVVCSDVAHGDASGGQLRNVLMITIDDLRPQLNVAYNMPEMKTPAMDSLAETGTVFLHAYCQFAVCSPSRNSFMTGRRPDTTKVWNFVDNFREIGVGANWTTLPEYFKKNGFTTYGQGKSFHPGQPPNNDFPKSWTVDAYNSYYWGNNGTSDAKPCKTNGFKERQPIEHWCGGTCTGGEHLLCPGDNATSDDDFYDHLLATRAVESLQQAHKVGKNFFVSVGFRRPHLAWRMPGRFWDMYENSEITVAEHQTIGVDVPIIAFERNSVTDNFTVNGTSWYEMGPNSPLPEELQRTLRRGYYAAVSFVDYEVSRVLSALDAIGETANTAVILHADHGWKLGEHGDWSKCTNWEMDARVPFIIRAPWIAASVGQKTPAIVELVDIFPTLVALSGLPPVPASEGLEGVSLVPVLNDPAAAAPHDKTMAFSQYPRCPEYSMWTDGRDWECLTIHKNNISRMGYSVRTHDVRYTEWRKWNGELLVGNWAPEGLVAQELYDHANDTGIGHQTYDDFEYVNLAHQAERKAQIAQLAAVLKAQFTSDAH